MTNRGTLICEIVCDKQNEDLRTLYFEIPQHDSLMECMRGARRCLMEYFGDGDYLDTLNRYDEYQFKVYTAKRSKRFLRARLTKPERFSQEEVIRL